MAVRIHTYQLEKAERYLSEIKNGARIAAMNAINRAMKAGAVQATKTATKEYTVANAAVKAKMQTSRASVSQLQARIKSRGRALKLSDYATRPGGVRSKQPKVLKVNVLRSTGFQPIKGAFLAVGKKTGKLGVFIRQTNARYPITQLYGPSIPEILGTKNVSEAVETRAQDVLGDRFNHEISRLMRKSLGR